MTYLNALISAHWSNPAILWALLPVIVVCTALGLYKKVAWFSLLLRLLSLTLIGLCLANPTTIETTESKELAALVDVSYSIPEQGLESFVAALKPYRSDSRYQLSLIPFAKESVQTPQRVKLDESDQSILSFLLASRKTLDTGDTDIGAALSNLASNGTYTATLLLSDGNETKGNARQSIYDAFSRGLKVYPLLGDSSVFLAKVLTISSFEAPLVSDSGDKVEIRTTVKNNSTDNKESFLEIFDGEQKLFSQKVLVNGQQERLFSAFINEPKGGLHHLRAELRQDAEAGSNIFDEESRWLSIKERDKVLLISGTKEEHRLINQILSLKGYALTELVADGSRTIPTSFTGYSSIVLNNVSKQQLPEGFLDNLRSYVRNGGGLLISGGDKSFGLGGYINSPLEEVSPVKFVPPQTTKKRLNNAVVLVMDKSRSMVEESKMEAAKAAALSSINSLKDDDLVGVVGFDSAPFVIIRLDKVAEVKQSAEHRLRNLTPRGQTNPLPALAAARQSLESSEAGNRHIILLSDGKFPIADNVYEDELERLKKAGITLSSVALGSDADVPFMRMMADYCKGTFYQTLDASNLPEIFLRDIKISTGEKTMSEAQEFPVEQGPAGLVSTSGSQFPFITGFVETLPKHGAQIELTTRKEKTAYPLLASWNYDKGKVVVFSSDASGRWTLPWLRWKPFANFWIDLVRSIQGSENEQKNSVDFDLRYTVQHHALGLDLSIFDPKLENQPAPHIEAKLVGPSKEAHQVSFAQSKKGRFMAELTNAQPGDYRIELKYGDISFPPLAISLKAEQFNEVPGQGINVALLSDLAYFSHAEINPLPEKIELVSKNLTRHKPLFVPLALCAFGLILFEAFVREKALLGLFSRFYKKTNVTVSSKRAKGQYGIRAKAA